MILGQMDFLWNRRHASGVGHYLNKIESCFISECLTVMGKNILILDASAGAGRFAIPLEKNGYRVIATDVEASVLNKLLERDSEIMACLVGKKIETLPLKDGSIDCVICIEVPYLAEKQWFWQECYRVLKPGGIVIATFLNRRSYKGFIRRLQPIRARYLRTGASPHEYEISFRDIYEQIVNLGFVKVGFRGYNWLPFTRHSNNKIIPLIAWVEHHLGLMHLVFISPWVLFCVQKPT